MLKKVFFINHAPKEFHNLLVVFVVSGMLLTAACFFYGEKRVYETLTVEHYQPFVESVYNEFVKNGYKKTLVDFEKLIKINEQAVKDAFAVIDKKSLNNLSAKTQIEVHEANTYNRFKASLGLPFEYSYKTPNWIGRFSAFALCWAGIALTLLLLNFTLKPIANRYKYFWFVPYILSIVIPFFLGVAAIANLLFP